MMTLRLLLIVIICGTSVGEAAAQTYERPRSMAGGSSHGGYSRGGGFYGMPGLISRGIGLGLHMAAPSGDEPPRHRPLRPGRTRIAHLRGAPEPSIVPYSQSVARLPPRGETRFLPNEILVVFRKGTSAARIAAIARRARIESGQVRDLALIGLSVHRFRFAGDRKLSDVLATLARLPQIASVEPHYLFALQGDAAASTPKPTTLSYAGPALHLDEAHKRATGRGVRVAVIDSEIDPAHPEIDGSIAAHFDALGSAKTEPDPHGTGMASAIAGHRTIEGSAPAAQILAVRVFDGDGGRAASLDVLSGIDWAAAQRAQVINMSFAGPADLLMSQMLAAAAQRKIVLIAAAGNDGPQAAPDYPAADPNVVAVSAVDAKSQVYVRANRGSYVTVAAPGVDVLVAAPHTAYDLSTGTSVACAEVSGIVALLLEKRPDLDGAALRRILRQSAHALTGAAGVGAGEADAEAAVGLAK